MADGRIDPLDVAALERSVNDSAGRVSSIWLSFVAFSAYLAAAASMISHRQIFLEEPIKLPTINIDLPLVASAILLPLLFVRSEEHTSELQSHVNLVCRLLLEKKKKINTAAVSRYHNRTTVSRRPYLGCGALA